MVEANEFSALFYTSVCCTHLLIVRWLLRTNILTFLSKDIVDYTMSLALSQFWLLNIVHC